MYDDEEKEKEYNAKLEAQKELNRKPSSQVFREQLLNK